MPQDVGTDACLDAVQAAEASHIPRNILQQLFDVVLKCNVFSFDSQMYQQIQGTAMGTRMAPSYALSKNIMFPGGEILFKVCIN